MTAKDARNIRTIRRAHVRRSARAAGSDCPRTGRGTDRRWPTRLAHYEQGVKLLRQCYQLLEQVQRRIELLNRVDSEGGAHCEPFDDRALSLEEKAASRGKRAHAHRKEISSSSSEDEIDGPGRLF